VIYITVPSYKSAGSSLKSAESSPAWTPPLSCWPTFSHFLIVNKTSLSLSLFWSWLVQSFGKDRASLTSIFLSINFSLSLSLSRYSPRDLEKRRLIYPIVGERKRKRKTESGLSDQSYSLRASTCEIRRLTLYSSRNSTCLENWTKLLHWSWLMLTMASFCPSFELMMWQYVWWCDTMYDDVTLCMLTMASFCPSFELCVRYE
jgi:hypothetical protein